MATRRVAVAGCRDLAGYDDDWPLIRDSLGTRGVKATYAIWDDPLVDWPSFDLVVIRSTWDYVPRAGDYLAWAERVAATTGLFNALDVLRWNIDKVYLADLAAEGINVIPTEWVTPRDTWAPPPGEFVVKPSISAGAVETARYGSDGHDQARVHVRRLQARGQTAMVQPYVQAVDREGEIAIIAFAGIFSHAARKPAVLRAGEGVAKDPMARLSVVPATPTPAQLALADTVAAALRRRFGRDPLYSRVDVVTGPSGDPLVLEVELIEPALFLPLAPGSADLLAAAIAAALPPAS